MDITEPQQRALAWLPRMSKIFPPLAAAILLFAAAMKWEQLRLAGHVDGGLLRWPGLMVGLIAFEVLLAAWLLVGTWPGWTRWILAGCFGLFAAAALLEALHGAKSCGCFGAIKVNPWLTFAFDLVMASALALWPPRADARRRWMLPRMAAVGCAVLLTLGLSLWRLPSASASAAGGRTGLEQVGSLTTLEADNLKGKPCPLLQYIDGGSQLSSGAWLVVLYHHDCHTCQQALPLYERYATSADAKSLRVALVEMPPYGDMPEVSGSPSCLSGRLSDKREWFAQTPLVLLLEDGKVVAAGEGENAVDPEAVLRQEKKVATGGARMNTDEF
jgi:hypothetical protein